MSTLPSKWLEINGEKVDAESIAQWFFQVDDPRQRQCELLVNAALAALKAEVRRNEAQWWADEQVEKDGELSARAAIRLAEIDAAVQGRRNEQ